MAATAAVVAAIVTAVPVALWLQGGTSRSSTTTSPATNPSPNMVGGPRLQMGWPCPYSPSPDVVAFKEWYCGSGATTAPGTTTPQ